MRVLLTGGSGFIGRALAERLLAAGMELRCLQRNPASLDGLPWRDRVSVVAVDLAGAEDQAPALAAACAGLDAVIHCAGLAHSQRGDLAEHRGIHVEGTRRLLEAAISARVPRFIYLSSSKADSAAQSPYGRAKREAEALLQAAHDGGRIQTCSLRPTAVYGPGMKGNLAAWMRLVGRGVAPPLPPSARTRVAMLGREDLCNAIEATLATPAVWGQVWTLSDGQAYTMKEIEGWLYAAWGRQAPNWSLPKSAFRAAALTGDLLKRAGLPAPFSSAGYNTLFCEDPQPDGAFQAATGWRPREHFHSALPSILAGIRR